MADQPGTVGVLASNLGIALTSLQSLLTAANATRLLAELGLDAPPDLTADSAFIQKLTDAGDQAAALVDDLDALADADGGTQAEVQALGALIEGIGRVVDALHDVAVDLERATAAAPDAAELAQFAATLVERLIGSVIVKSLEIEHPLLRRILSLLTVVELQTATVQVGSDQVEVLRRRLHVDRFSRLISDPLSVLQEGYGWGDSDFDGKQLMSNTRDLFDVLLPLAVTRDEDQDGPADLDFFGILVRTTTAVTPPGLEASIFVSVPGPLDFTLAQLSDTIRCALQTQGTLFGRPGRAAAAPGPAGGRRRRDRRRDGDTGTPEPIPGSVVAHPGPR